MTCPRSPPPSSRACHSHACRSRSAQPSAAGPASTRARRGVPPIGVRPAPPVRPAEARRLAARHSR
eukprot:1022945-Pleurochrysis_carterae.AAC.1